MKKIVILLLSLSFFSCSNSEEVTETETPTTEPDMFIKGKISNVPFEYNYFENTTNTYFETESTFADEGAGENSYNYSSGLKNHLTENKNSFNITFYRLHYGTHQNETTSFQESFSANNGHLDYLDANDYEGNIIIKYYDENGILYKSNLGDNTSNYLFTTDREFFTVNGVQHVILKGTFYGKVYRASNPTQYKYIYDGHFKLKYTEFVE